MSDYGTLHGCRTALLYDLKGLQDATNELRTLVEGGQLDTAQTGRVGFRWVQLRRGFVYNTHEKLPQMLHNVLCHNGGPLEVVPDLMFRFSDPGAADVVSYEHRDEAKRKGLIRSEMFQWWDRILVGPPQPFQLLKPLFSDLRLTPQWPDFEPILSGVRQVLDECRREDFAHTDDEIEAAILNIVDVHDGDWMWHPEKEQGRLALQDDPSRVPLTLLTQGLLNAVSELLGLPRVDGSRLKGGLERLNHAGTLHRHPLRYLRRATFSTERDEIAEGLFWGRARIASRPPEAMPVQATPIAEWEPPPGYVGAKTITTDERYRKHGKNPPRTTLQQWVDRDKRDAQRDRRKPVQLVTDPKSREKYYPVPWIKERLEQWRPRTTPST